MTARTFLRLYDALWAVLGLVIIALGWAVVALIAVMIREWLAR